MRFTVVAYGSAGDTRPIVALARGLLESGHDLLMFCDQSAVDTVRSHGVSSTVLPGEIKGTLPIGDPSSELRKAEVIRAIRGMSSLIRSSTLSWMELVAAHAEKSDAILMSGLASPMAQAVADGLNKLAIRLWLQPTTPTVEFPSPMLPPWNLPAWLNRMTYVVSPENMMQRSYGEAAHAAYRKLFGTRTHRQSSNACTILYGISPRLVEQPKDWPVGHTICGYWPLPSPAWQPPQNLAAFLAEGDPPIYVGFGAASFFLRKKGIAEIIAAVDGRRALFYPGWSKIGSDSFPANFFVVDDTPHSWLFPQTSMVIHHCGAGTSHTAAQAGVPSVGIPLGGDQPFWAGRLTRAGVAPRYLSAAKLNAKSLAERIRFCEQQDVRRRAAALGSAMARENGITVAVKQIIESSKGT